MKLYPHDLRGIADALDSFKTAKGIKITNFQYGNLTITVEQLEDQRDGKSLYVTGIRDTIGNDEHPSWTPHKRDISSWVGQRDS